MPLVARPLREDELADFLEHAERGYGDDMIAGGIDVREARETAARDVAGLLPDGLATAGHHLLVLEDDEAGERRGVLWFAEERGGRRTAHVYDVEIDEPYRGRGPGRAAMELFERLPSDLGAGIRRPGGVRWKRGGALPVRVARLPRDSAPDAEGATAAAPG